MKKLLAIALIIFSSSFTKAQTPVTQPAPSNGKFRGGIMINPLIGWQNANVDDPVKNKVTSSGAQFGFAYGLLGEYFFNNNYGLSLNPRVTAFTSQFQYTPDLKNHPDYSINRTVNLQYVEVPLSLKMRTNEVGYMKYFGQVGLMPAVKLSARGNIDVASSTGSSSVSGLNVTDSVNLFMMYLVIGVGAEYNLGGTSSIIGSITWNNGFTNVWNRSKNADYRKDNDFSSAPANISLNIGFMF
jgi:hypothetical protein